LTFIWFRLRKLKTQTRIGREFFAAAEGTTQIKNLRRYEAAIRKRAGIDGTIKGKRAVKYTIDKRAVEYLLRPEEIFARAFAQHVAIRSGDDQALSELAAQVLVPTATDLGGLTSDSLHYFDQWQPKRFEQIAPIFDKLLLEMRWIKHARNN